MNVVHVLCLSMLALLGTVRCKAEEPPAVSAPKETWKEQYKLLMDARSMILAGRLQDAIDGPLSVVATFFENKYKNEERRIYCANSATESLYYLLLSAKDKGSAIAIDAPWATTYYMKAYAFFELGNLDQAKMFIGKAVALSPANSQYLAELGHYFQLEKNWAKSIDLFRQAEAGANLASQEDLKKMDLGRAKRGIAFCLVEQGALEAAAKEYQECLRIDPNDTRAAKELAFVKEEMSKKR